MPTVLRVGRFRFFFNSNEGQEPAHIHVKAAENDAKFWLEPIGPTITVSESGLAGNRIDRRAIPGGVIGGLE
jgi:hypothetical protein